MKILMLDGFKPEYLKYAPYLSSLTRKYQWGEMSVGPGHWGVEEIVFHSKSAKISLFVRNENSSLRWIRYFTWLDYFGSAGRFVVDSVVNFFRLVRGYELFRTAQIPLDRIWKFDFCVSRPLWKIRGIDKKYFGELDKIGHKYGTKSKELIMAVRKLDKRLEKMDFDLIFSDHGMVDITKTVRVPITRDCFIDSDMARYWGSKEELESVRKRLPMKHGEILNWPDKRFGDLIFLAKTGVLILPNFWQGNKMVKAMHGYDGKHKDMNAFYVVKKPGKRKDIDVYDLHKIVMEMRNEI